MQSIGLQEVSENLASRIETVKKRDYIWATDLGKGFYERYLKMKGIVPDLKLTGRQMRVFGMGILIENYLRSVYETIGIVKSKQEYLTIPETGDHLKITGRLDFTIGGIADWGEARDRVAQADIEDFTKDLANGLIDFYEQKCPDGVEERIVEVKSQHSQSFWRHADTGFAGAYPFHELQLYFYMKAAKKNGVLVYYSRDDQSMVEVPINYPTDRLEEALAKDIINFSLYFRGNTEPPKPESVIFDSQKWLTFYRNKQKHRIQGCWVKNWEVGWSKYIKRITGFDNDKDWYRSISPEISRRNKELKDNFILNQQKNEAKRV